MTATLPLSPLTNHELHERSQHATHSAGISMRCAFDCGVDGDSHGVSWHTYRALEHAAIAEENHLAFNARLEEN